jgi:hypothetical protein
MANEFKIKKGLIVNETDLYVSESKAGIGTVTPTEALTVQGNISSSGLISAPNLGTGEDNSVIILDSDGKLRTDEIDSRVWGSTLVDGSGTAGRVTYWTDSNSITSNANLTFNGSDLAVGGNLTVDGTVTAQEFHTEFVSASIIYQSGSTKFGDTSDDVHSFSGSLRVTGSGDHYFTDGNVGIGTTSPDSNLHVLKGSAGTVTALANSIITAEYSSNGYVSILVPDANESGILFGRPTSNVDGGIIYNNSGTTRGLQFRTSGNDTKMVINSSGNVGIGTTSPASILNTSGSNQGITHDDSTTGKGYIRFRNGGTQLALFGVAGSWEGSTLQDTMIAAETGHNIRFYTNGTGTPKMYISGSGNVGIGTTSPSEKLTVEGNISASGTIQSDDITIVDGTNDVNLYLANTSYGIQLDYSAGDIFFRTNGANRLTVDNDGKVGIGTTSPSAKLHVDGDAIITGKVTAQEFHTEFVSASIIYQSGSTKFGDTSDDIHSFSGSLRVTGSGDHYFTDGNVGIGTTSPDDKLHVVGNLFIENLSPEITLETGASHYNWQIAAQENVDAGLEFSVGSQDADASNDTFSPLMTIKNTGNVGIGTTSPANKLEVNDTQTTIPQFQIRETSSAYHRFGILKSGSFVHFVEPGNDGLSAAEYLMTINMNGNNVGIGTTSPYSKLEAYQSAAGAPLRLRSESGNSGNVGMMFSVADDTVTTDAYQKGAIYFQGDGTGNAVGDLVFAVNNTNQQYKRFNI